MSHNFDPAFHVIITREELATLAAFAASAQEITDSPQALVDRCGQGHARAVVLLDLDRLHQNAVESARLLERAERRVSPPLNLTKQPELPKTDLFS